MGEAAPELEPKLPLVEVGVKFRPFEYDNTLPEVEQGEPGALFTKKFSLRDVDNFLLTFDQETNPQALKQNDAVTITKEGVKRLEKGQLTPKSVKEQELFELVIDFSDPEAEKTINWYLEFPAQQFKASGVLDRIDLPTHLFRDEQTGREISVFVQRNLDVLKELQLQFLRKQKLTPVK